MRTEMWLESSHLVSKESYGLFDLHDFKIAQIEKQSFNTMSILLLQDFVRTKVFRFYHRENKRFLQSGFNEC
jgi:hypothetical protein